MEYKVLVDVWAFLKIEEDNIDEEVETNNDITLMKKSNKKISH